MNIRADTFGEVARLIIGASVGAIGIALIADQRNLLGFFVYLAGLSIGLSGALTIILKGLISAVYTGIFVAVFYDEISAMFEAPGPDWWAYFWWVPVLVVVGILSYGYLIFRQL